ncbi:hypothetical protein [Comamonas humi]
MGPVPPVGPASTDSLPVPSAFTNPPADSDGTTTPFVLKLVMVVEPC